MKQKNKTKKAIEKDLEGLRITCACGGKTEKVTTKWKGIECRAWRCLRCGEEILNPVDAQRALELAKEKEKLKVKIRKVGKSIILTVPSPIVKNFKLHEGEIATWVVKGPNKFLINLL